MHRRSSVTNARRDVTHTSAGLTSRPNSPAPPPASVGELRDRYARLVAGAPDEDKVWLNWVVRRRLGGEPVGAVQATVKTRGTRSTAYVVWVIGVNFQNQGLASEAARALVGWLRERGVDDVVAHIHPHHRHPPSSQREPVFYPPTTKPTASRSGARPAE
jgi:hypothetical protein